MISDALSYPFDTGTDNLAAGGLLLFFSITLFPFVLIMGYLVNVYRDSLDSSPEPPEIPGMPISRLFKDGVMYLGVISAYFALPVLVLGVTATISTPSGPLRDFLTIIVTVCFVFAGVGVPAAMLHAIDRGTLKAAFALNDIVRTVATPKYLLAIVAAGIIWCGFLILLAVLIVMLIIGWLLIPVAWFYMGIVFHRLFGRAYAASQVTAVSPETSRGV